jgi:hypothetical protein
VELLTAPWFHHLFLRNDAVAIGWVMPNLREHVSSRRIDRNWISGDVDRLQHRSHWVGFVLTVAVGLLKPGLLRAVDSVIAMANTNVRKYIEGPAQTER